MATTLNPARPFPGAGVYPLDSGHFDEAFAKTGTARPPYVAVMDALARQDLVELRERVRSNKRIHQETKKKEKNNKNTLGNTLPRKNKKNSRRHRDSFLLGLGSPLHALE